MKRFVVLRLDKGSAEYSVYHTLDAETLKDAVKEASGYLCGGGAPATGNPDDSFYVAQVKSKSWTAREAFFLSVLKDSIKKAAHEVEVLKQDSAYR